MLPRIHRITAGADYRLVQRTGRRVPTSYFVLSIMKTPEGSPARFGFVASKAVGNAVVRNTVRRRMRALAQVSIDSSLGSVDIVVRVLPDAAQAKFSQLREAWDGAMERGLAV